MLPSLFLINGEREMNRMRTADKFNESLNCMMVSRRKKITELRKEKTNNVYEKLALDAHIKDLERDSRLIQRIKKQYNTMIEGEM